MYIGSITRVAIHVVQPKETCLVIALGTSGIRFNQVEQTCCLPHHVPFGYRYASLVLDESVVDVYSASHRSDKLPPGSNTFEVLEVEAVRRMQVTGSVDETVKTWRASGDACEETHTYTGAECEELFLFCARLGGGEGKAR